MAEFIQCQGGLYEKINLHLFVDKRATKASVEKRLSEIFEAAKKEDTLLLFFSGHGESFPEREDEYFVCLHDSDPTRLVSTGIVLSGMRMIKEVKTRRAVVICDTCFSGASVDLQSTSGGISLSDFMRDFAKSPTELSSRQAALLSPRWNSPSSKTVSSPTFS